MAAKRLLLLVRASSYRTGDFTAAASRYPGLAVTVGTDGRQVLAEAAGTHNLHVPFDDLTAGIEVITHFARSHPIKAIVGTDDATVELAAGGAAVGQACVARCTLGLTRVGSVVS